MNKKEWLKRIGAILDVVGVENIRHIGIDIVRHDTREIGNDYFVSLYGNGVEDSIVFSGVTQEERNDLLSKIKSKTGNNKT